MSGRCESARPRANTRLERTRPERSLYSPSCGASRATVALKAIGLVWSQTLRGLVLKVIFVGLLVLCVTEAKAQCSCPERYVDITPHAEFKLADFVVVAEILEIKKTEIDEKSGNYTETVNSK